MARILVVDDNQSNLNLIQDMLEAIGQQVYVASSGSSALESYRSLGRLDLIFLDIQMPKMSGGEVLQQLRQEGCKLPIVAVTAMAMQGDREKLLEQGFDAYVSKPLGLQDLRLVLRETFSKA